MDIQLKSTSKPKLVKKVFRYQSHEYFVTTLIGLGIIFWMDTAVSFDNESWEISGGWYGFLFLIFVAAVVVYRALRFSRCLQHWPKVSQGCAQFLSMTHLELHYGYEGLIESRVSWQAIAHAELSERSLTLEVGGTALKFNVEHLQPEERERLTNFLKAKGFLKK